MADLGSRRFEVLGDSPRNLARRDAARLLKGDPAASLQMVGRAMTRRDPDSLSERSSSLGSSPLQNHETGDC